MQLWGYDKDDDHLMQEVLRGEKTATASTRPSRRAACPAAVSSAAVSAV